MSIIKNSIKFLRDNYESKLISTRMIRDKFAKNVELHKYEYKNGNCPRAKEWQKFNRAVAKCERWLKHLRR